MHELKDCCAGERFLVTHALHSASFLRAKGHGPIFTRHQEQTLKYNEDGSPTIFVRSESSAKDKETNWLPTPKDGYFRFCVRAYWPKAKIVDGSWTPPPVEQTKNCTVRSPRSFAMLAEAINVRKVGGGIIYGPIAKLTP
jgi:Protein of unknown function (DUF1214)